MGSGVSAHEKTSLLGLSCEGSGLAAVEGASGTPALQRRSSPSGFLSTSSLRTRCRGFVPAELSQDGAQKANGGNRGADRGRGERCLHLPLQHHDPTRQVSRKSLPVAGGEAPQGGLHRADGAVSGRAEVTQADSLAASPASRTKYEPRVCTETLLPSLLLDRRVGRSPAEGRGRCHSPPTPTARGVSRPSCPRGNHVQTKSP